MKNRGFSLIELICVIAILASLASMLFPVFVSAKKASFKATCLTNLKQIGIATEIYMGDHDDHYPYGVNPIEKISPRILYGRPKEINPSGLPSLVDGLVPYIKDSRIGRCAADRGGLIF
jgi:prepilin-type N-terminal cleavage/methylation domain-containing protein